MEAGLGNREEEGQILKLTVDGWQWGVGGKGGSSNRDVDASPLSPWTRSQSFFVVE